jgi:transporter family-2 protein
MSEQTDRVGPSELVGSPWARLRSLGAAVGPATIAFLVGVSMTVQTLVNSHLAHSLGSAIYAGIVNNALGLFLFLIAAGVLGVPRRVARRRRRGWRPTRWQLVAGANGGLWIAGAAYSAPRIGLAMVTVAMVVGLLAGGMIVDRAGFGPTGRQPVTAARAVGVVLALIATVLGASGAASGHLRVELLVFIAALGLTTAAQLAAMGRVSADTGEPVFAGILNLQAGLALLLVLALLTHGPIPPNGWSAPPIEWIGGLFAVFGSLGVVAAVRRIGVLRLMLGIVAGQTLGALVLDAVDPVAPVPVTAVTFVSVALTIAAVYVSGLRRA